MDRNELMKLYYERRKEFDDAQGRRAFLVLLLFVGFYSVILFYIIKPDSLKGFLAVLAISAVLAGFHFWVNFGIFEYLFKKSREEAERLAQIRKQIEELE